MGWLNLFLARLAMGERWRKSTTEEKRYGAALFFFVPVGFSLLLILMRSGSRVLRLMDTSRALALWIDCTAAVTAAVFGCHTWGKHVSVRTSMALAIIAWLVLLWILF